MKKLFQTFTISLLSLISTASFAQTQANSALINPEANLYGQTLRDGDDKPAIYIDDKGWYAFSIPAGGKATPDPESVLFEWQIGEDKFACTFAKSEFSAEERRGLTFQSLQSQLPDLFKPAIESGLIRPEWVIEGRTIIEIGNDTSANKPKTAIWRMIYPGNMPMLTSVIMGPKGSLVGTCFGKNNTDLIDVIKNQLRIGAPFAEVN